MKIVIATPFYPPERGVLGMYAEGLGNALRKQGHEVVDGVFSRFRGLPPGIRHIAYFWHVFRAARGAAFVLALDTWSVGMPAFYAAWLRRVPLCARIGGDFLWETYVERTKDPVRFSEFYATDRAFSLKEKVIRRFIRTFVRNAHALFFNSRFQRDIWQKKYDIQVGKTHILENVFPGKHAAAEVQNRIFVSAGRHIALKKYDELEQAFARVKERYPKAELDERVLPHAEHQRRVADSYAVIIPSVSEIASNTAIDAVMMGKPFIMTDDTGTSERLGECGIFVDTRSEDALAAAIEKMLNPDDYAYFLARIREFSFTHSWDDMAKEVIGAFEQQR